MTDLITEDLVVLDLVATDKADATRQLAQKLQAAGRVTDLEGFLADVAAREAQMATGMPGGIGLPHARSEHVTSPVARPGQGSGRRRLRCAGRPGNPGVPHRRPRRWRLGAPDHPGGAGSPAGPACLQADHSRCPRRCVGGLLRARRGGPEMKFVAVTSCPTGIAHTYMAAENLEQTGKDQGHDVQVETQGSAGTIPLSDEVIAAADGVIFAADLEVKGKERFAGKPFVDVGVKAAVHKPLDVMAAAVAAVENAPKAGTPAAAAAAAAAPAKELGPVRPQGRRRNQGPSVVDGRRLVHDPVRRCGRHADRPRIPVRRRRRSSTSSMAEPSRVSSTRTSPATLPVGFSNGGTIRSCWRTPDSPGLLFVIGKIAFFMLVPILSGFIAFAIADRPGLVPGIVGGLICGPIGAGFLGGLVSGFIAGGLAYGMTRLKVPKGVRGIMPVVVIPLVTTILIGVIMFLVLGRPSRRCRAAWRTGCRVCPVATPSCSARSWA